MQKPKQVLKKLNTGWLGIRSKFCERNLTRKEEITWCVNSRRQLLPVEWAAQRGIKSGSGNGIWNAHERKGHFTRKPALSLYRTSKFPVHSVCGWSWNYSLTEAVVWHYWNRKCLLLSLRSVSSLSHSPWPLAASSCCFFMPPYTGLGAHPLIAHREL